MFGLIRETSPTYMRGIAFLGLALVIGHIGVQFFDDFLSSSPVLTWAFVLLVTALGLSGAVVVAYTFWLRHDVFRKKHRSG